MASKENTRDESGREHSVTLSAKVGEKILKVFTDNVKHESWWKDYFLWKEIVDRFMTQSKDNESKYHTTATNIFIAIKEDKANRDEYQKKSRKRFWTGVTIIGILDFFYNLERILSAIGHFFG